MKKSKLRQEQEGGMNVRPHRMTEAHERIAREIGGGNESEGVRIALEEAKAARLERRRGPTERRRPKP